MSLRLRLVLAVAVLAAFGLLVAPALRERDDAAVGASQASDLGPRMDANGREVRTASPSGTSEEAEAKLAEISPTPRVVPAFGVDGQFVIRLGSGAIDTSRSSSNGVLAAEAGSLAAGSGQEYWIVQFGGPVTETVKENLRATGAVLAGYLPENAFAVRADGAAILRMASVAGVHWIGAFRAEYKVSPRLARKLAAQNPERVEVEVSSFAAEETAELAAELAKLGGTDISEIHNGEFGAVRAEVPADSIAAIAGLGTSQWIAERVRPKLMNHRAVEGPRLNVTNLWASYGLNGSNQIVAVADTGLDSGSLATLHPDFAGRVKATQALGRNNKWDDPDGHGTHVCGSVLGDGTMSAGTYRGVAWAAQLVLQSLLDNMGSLGGIPSSLSTLFTPAYTNGARVHSDSWGAPVGGSYDLNSQGVDSFVWSKTNMVIVIAAGNEGTDANNDGVVDVDSMSAPGTAKNCITVGAAENEQNPGDGSGYTYGLFSGFAVNPLFSDAVSQSSDGVHQGMAAFSSRGPCSDGRTKPDIVAPGTDVISTRSRAASGTGWGVAPGNTNYMIDGGTSMATPLTAGCVALFRQYFTERTTTTNPSAALLKGALLNAARSLWPGQHGTGAFQEIPNAPRPNNVEGWGHLDLENTIFPPAPTVMGFVDGITLTTGATNVQVVRVAGTNALRVTLCWSDYMATIGAAKQLVNDLDLVVVDPNGVTNRPRGMAVADRTNNVEGIDFAAAVPGTYTIRVSGFNVPNGPQPFALVARGPIVPSIQHTPLLKTTNTVSPYAVDANITSLAVVDTNQLFVWWSTNGATFAAAPMARLSNTLYRGFIPAQPLLTTISYYISAATNGLADTLPADATNSVFQFSVNANIPPVFVAASGGFTNAELSAFVFTNSAADADVPTNTLTFTLLAPPAGMTIVSNSGVIAWTPTEAQGPTNVVVNTIVTDNGEPPQTATNTFVLTITETNASPVFIAITTKTNIEMNLVTLTNRAADTDIPSNTLSYALLVAPTGMVISTNGIITWATDEADGPSTNLITTVATDDGTPPRSVTNSFTLIIRETNTQPVVTLVATQVMDELTSLTLTNLATDADLPTNSLSYTLVTSPSGMTINTNTAVLAWTPTETQGPTSQIVRIRVADKVGAPVTSTFTIVVAEINVAPVPPATSNRTMMEVTTLILTNRSTDADLPTNRLAYLLLDAPPGMTLNTNSGVITWTPDETMGDTTNLVTVLTTDSGVPPLSGTNSFFVFVIDSNSAPTLTFPNTQTNLELTAITFTNTATDSDIPTNTITFSLLAAPTGAVIDATSGVVTWTPTESQGPATGTIIVAATDDGVPPRMSTGRVFVIVREVNSAPQFAAVPDAARVPGQLLLLTNSASDTDLPTNKLTFALLASPTGAVIGATNGMVTWTPPASSAGTTNLFTVRVTDTGVPPLTGMVSFAVSVNLPTVNILGTANADGFILSWPAGTPFALESATNLFDPVTWLVVTNPPSTNGPFLLLTNPPINGLEFFRLRWP